MAKTVELTKEYKVIEKVQSSTYSELRLYGKYNTQNTIEATSNVTLEARLYGDGGSGSFDRGTLNINGDSIKLGNTSYSKESEKVLGSVTFDVKHDEQGNYLNKAITAGISTSGKVNGSLIGYISLPNIPRSASIVSTTDFTDEENPSVEFLNPADFIVHPFLNFYDDDNKLVYSLERNISASSPYNWNISDAERTAMQKATNKQKKYRVEVGVNTYNESTKIGSSSISKTMTYVNAEPEQSTTFLEMNQKVIDVLKKNNCDTIIQNVSKVKLASNPIAKKEAEIKSVQFIHNNIAINKSSAPYEYTYEVVNSVFQIKVIDSRGYEKEYSYTKNIIEYSQIDITSFSFKRESSVSSNIILNANIKYVQTNFENTSNLPTIQWKMGEDGKLNTLTSSNYTINQNDKTISIKNISLGEILTYKESKRFYLYVNDLLTTDQENDLVLVGIPTTAEGRHHFRVNGDLFIADQEGKNRTNVKNELLKLKDSLEKKVMILGLDSNTNFSFEKAWEYKKITLNKIRFQCGEGLSFKDNQIFIDDDVKLIRIGANITLNNSDGVSVVAIYKNSDNVSTSICDGYVSPISTARFETLSISPIFIDAKKGDSFSLYMCSGNDNKNIQIAGNNNSWLTLEIIE